MGIKYVCIFIIKCKVIQRSCWQPCSSASYALQGQAYFVCAPFCDLPFYVFVKNGMHKQRAHLHVLNSYTVDVVVNKEDNKIIDKNMYEYTPIIINTTGSFRLLGFWQRTVLERISLQRSKLRIYGSCLFPGGGKVPHGSLPRVIHLRTSYSGASDIHLNSANKIWRWRTT